MGNVLDLTLTLVTNKTRALLIFDHSEWAAQFSSSERISRREMETFYDCLTTYTGQDVSIKGGERSESKG